MSNLIRQSQFYASLDTRVDLIVNACIKKTKLVQTNIQRMKFDIHEEVRI